MKKICIFLLAALMAVTTFAATAPVKPVLKATEVFIPIGKSGQSISLFQLAHIDIAEFERVSGNKLAFTDRVSFRLAQRHLRKGIADDGTIQDRKLRKAAMKVTAGETGFHAGGFFLGFLLGVIGVLITLLFKDDYKKNRTKWALIGWAIWLVAFLALRVALSAATL